MRRRILIILASVIALVAIVASAVLAVFASSFNKGNFYLVDEELFEKASKGKNTVYLAYGSNGELTEVFNTSSIIGQEWISLDEVGENLKNAFISAEDREFYDHRGINIKRTLGAIFNYVFHVKSRFGASTITQQVIKNISGNSEATARRKFNEILRALHLERLHTKDEILEVYMNIVPMTGNICGVLLASDIYFGKSPSELTAAEAATIAGITNSPGKYNPYSNPEECREKRNRVLRAMLENSVISEELFTKSCAEELNVLDRESTDDVYSWFIETANSEIVRDLVAAKGISPAAARLLMRGCRVVLTENPEIQEILEEFFSDETNLPRGCHSGQSFAMTVIDNASGNLVGVIGGAGSKAGNNLLNLAEIPVPPASALKPLALYAPMLDEGLINWSTVIDDTPISVKENGDKLVGYPVNSPNVYSGLTTVNDAIRVSKNTVAVKLLKDYGLKRCADGLVKRYGFNVYTTPTSVSGRTVSDLDIAPLALGQLSAGVSIRNLTEAYSAFAREGKYSYSRSYLGVFDFDGRVLVQPEVNERTIYKPETCRLINQMLMNVVESGTARSVSLKNLVDTAGKTGTSSGNYDRLFVGYTPYYTAGIWTGYPDRSGGVEASSPSHIQIWDSVMTRVHESCAFDKFGETVKSFSTEGLTRLAYCLDSGLAVGEECEYDLRGSRIAYGYFTDDNMPVNECELHAVIDTLDERISAPRIKREELGVEVLDQRFAFDSLMNSDTTIDGKNEE